VSADGPSTFAILPAIDLRAGRVVRLAQGDFSREQVFGGDPAAVARGFAAQGAAWIHLVDLDGARAGERRQAATMRSVAEALTGLGDPRPRLQIAGGLRDGASVQAALDDGADRVVIGTAALGGDEMLAQLVARHGPDRIAVAVDVRGDQAMGDGWVPGAVRRRLDELLAQLDEVGVATLVVTAIARDGLLGGPDLALLERVLDRTGAATIASGGLRSIEDLRAVRRIGCRGAIVGRALYDGGLNLGSALDALGGADR
jgi:phosphoribosylformimino-5-aminoimidazole carboxamide ribotide isomerase